MTGTRYEYQAFISYRHAARLPFARSLEQALKGYAKPFLSRPPRIFRDEKHFSPGNDLPRLITCALDRSEFLVLLASPESAASGWVQHELRYWCQTLKRTDQLIIVLTDGVISAAEGTGELDWTKTTALPQVLEPHLEKVPLYCDLSWARTASDLDLSVPRFKQDVNAISARLRGLDPNAMLGEEVLQHRRKMRLLVAGLVTVTAVAIAALAMYVRAELLLRESESRALASESLRATRQPQKLRLALQSAERAATKQSEDALRDALASPAPRRLIRAHAGRVEHAEFSPHDGKELLTTGSEGASASWAEGRTRLWDTETGRLLHEFEEGGATSRFSHDGTMIVAGTQRGFATLWRRAAAGWARVGRLGEPETAALRQGYLVEFSPDDRLVAWGKPGHARLFRTSDGREIAALKNPVSVSFSPDGRWLLGADLCLDPSNGCSARIWDTATGALEKVIEHPTGVYDARFDPSGARFVTASQDALLRIFHWEEERRDWRLAHVLSGHSEAVKSVAMGPRGKHFLSASFQDGIGLWDLESGARKRGFGGATTEVRFHPDAERIYYSQEDAVFEWPLREGANAARYAAHHGTVTSFALSTDGTQLVTAGRDGVAAVWSTGIASEFPVWPAPAALRRIELTEDSLTAVSKGQLWRSDPEGRFQALWPEETTDSGSLRILATSRGMKSVLWMDREGRAWLTPDLQGDARVLLSAKFLGRLHWLDAEGRAAAAVADEHHVRLWRGGRDPVPLLRCEPDCRFAELLGWCGANSTHLLVSTRAGGVLRTYGVGAEPVSRTLPPSLSHAFSPDGHLLALQHRGSRALQVFSTESGELLWEAPGRAPLRQLAFDPTGELLFAGDMDGGVALWTARSGERLADLPDAHDAAVLEASFSRSGRLLATATTTEIAVWDLRTRSRVFEFPASWPRSLLFDGDEKALLYLERGAVWRRLLTHEALTQAARARLDLLETSGPLTRPTPLPP